MLENVYPYNKVDKNNNKVHQTN